MPNISFKIMSFLFRVMDLFYSPEKRIKKFKIKSGEVVIDYGCGPGRYTKGLSYLVGKKGKVYAVDVHKLAIESVKEKIRRYELKNVNPVLAKGYSSNIQSHIADKIIALDMFHMIEKPQEFFKEIYRLIKKKGVLIIDDGHQSRKETKNKIIDSGFWKIKKEMDGHLICIPIK